MDYKHVVIDLDIELSKDEIAEFRRLRKLRLVCPSPIAQFQKSIRESGITIAKDFTQVVDGVQAAWHFALLLRSSTIALGAYNFLKTWVDSRNGRKFNLKIDNFEIEASQMNEEQFLGFVERMKQVEAVSSTSTKLKKSAIG